MRKNESKWKKRFNAIVGTILLFVSSISLLGATSLMYSHDFMLSLLLIALGVPTGIAGMIMTKEARSIFKMH